MSEFLDNLKRAADEGEFNSNAAKKILEINDLADQKIGKHQGEGEPVSEEKALEANTEYELKMAQLKKLDMVNGQLATLIDIEDMVKLSIEDMFSFTDELETKFKKELEGEDKMFGDLHLKIEEIKLKYKSIIN